MHREGGHSKSKDRCRHSDTPAHDRKQYCNLGGRESTDGLRPSPRVYNLFRLPGRPLQPHHRLEESSIPCLTVVVLIGLVHEPWVSYLNL